MTKENAKQIKELIEQFQALIIEEEGWEPTTSRDYRILTWAQLKRLEGIPDRVTRLESNQNILAGIQAAFTVIAATLAGYLGIKK